MPWVIEKRPANIGWLLERAAEELGIAVQVST
jgi:hypothetical protein